MWKALGLAGLAGVAATGAIIVRDERRRAQLTPEQVRDRLHERVKDLPPQNIGATGFAGSHRSPRAEVLRAAIRDRRTRRKPRGRGHRPA